MRMLLNLPDPSPDWRGLARVVSKSESLRDDVTFVVERDQFRFFDSELREIPTEVASEKWTMGTIAQLSAKLSLLDWLHERFPREASAPILAARNDQNAASYLTDEVAARGSHSAASQSTS